MNAPIDLRVGLQVFLFLAKILSNHGFIAKRRSGCGCCSTLIWMVEQLAEKANAYIQQQLVL